MWLWYDWQAAAVADDDGIIHDSAVWDGFFDQRALIERLPPSDRVACGRSIRNAGSLCCLSQPPGAELDDG